MKAKMLTLTEEKLARMATGSLYAMALMEDYSLPDKLILTFPQSTRQWREQNGGPAHLIIPEFLIPCLLEDVLKLCANGVQVEIQMSETVTGEINE